MHVYPPPPQPPQPQPTLPQSPSPQAWTNSKLKVKPSSTVYSPEVISPGSVFGTISTLGRRAAPSSRSLVRLLACPATCLPSLLVCVASGSWAQHGTRPALVLPVQLGS